MSFEGISPEEGAYLDVVDVKVPGGFVLFDVGASFGNYTDMVRHRSDKQVVAHLFEPRASAYQKLVEKYRDDGLTVINHTALGYRTAEMRLSICEDPEHSFVPALPEQVGDTFEIVKVTKLDDYIEQTALHHFSVYLKIDTEGYEMEVLIGAQESLDMSIICAIQFEYGGTWTRRPWRLREAKAILKTFGFKIFEYREGAVVELEDFTDHYTYTNYLAIRP